MLLSPVPHRLRKVLSNPERKASAGFCAMQALFFVFTPFTYSLKNQSPAVKWCNPDAATMLLSVHHQRHRLFYKRKLLLLLINSK